MEPAAALEQQRAMVERSADLGGELHARDDASTDPELFREQVRLLLEMWNMRCLMGQLEVAGADVVAIDLIGVDRLLDQGERLERRLVALAAAHEVFLEQRGEVELESRVDHAPVSGAGTPSHVG